MVHKAISQGIQQNTIFPFSINSINFIEIKKKFLE